MNKTLQAWTDIAGRVAVSLGIVIAMASAVVVINASPTLLDNAAVRQAEVVRLEPVTVTISAARFDEIRAEGASRTMVAAR